MTRVSNIISVRRRCSCFIHEQSMLIHGTQVPRVGRRSYRKWPKPISARSRKLLFCSIYYELPGMNEVNVPSPLQYHNTTCRLSVTSRWHPHCTSEPKKMSANSEQVRRSQTRVAALEASVLVRCDVMWYCNNNNRDLDVNFEFFLCFFSQCVLTLFSIQL